MTDEIKELEAGMTSGTMRSKVPELLRQRNWRPIELVRRGFSVHTAYRLAKGDTDITLGNVKRLCDIFSAQGIEDVVQYVKDGE